MATRAPFPALRQRLPALAALLLSLCMPIAVIAAPATSGDSSLERRIVVAIAEKPDPIMANGSSPRGYAGLPAYSGSERTRATSTRLAREYDLTEISAWTIEPLQVRCMLYEIPASADRESVLAALRGDRRVRLAQPLQEFSTLTTPAADPHPLAGGIDARFNDPYVGLQTGFSSIGAGQAQRWSSGENVSVALIDTGVDAAHPDLAGRVGEQRDFVAGEESEPGRDRHGTEVAGIIAAVANNGLGIVGVAPSVNLLSYRACWPIGDGASRATCNSFTLAQALAAAIRARARVINLSLGGPRDPLLAELLEHAIAHGTIIVGAVAPNAETQGFPISTAGVIAVDSSGKAHRSVRSALRAPGDEILTLEPGGSYDYASGSSLATAHVTGAIALLLQIAPKLDEKAVVAMLRDSVRYDGGPIDACVAIRAASGNHDACDEDSRAGGTTHGAR